MRHTHTHTHIRVLAFVFMFSFPILMQAQCWLFDLSEVEAHGSFGSVDMYYRFESIDNNGRFITNSCPDFDEGRITLFFASGNANKVDVCIEFVTGQYNVDISSLSEFDSYTLQPDIVDPILGTVSTQICGEMTFGDFDDCKSVYLKLKPLTYAIGQGSNFVRDIKTTISDINNSNSSTDITLNVNNALLEQYIIAEDSDNDGHIYFSDYAGGAPYSANATGVYFPENVIVHVDGSFNDGFIDYKYQFGRNSSLVVESGSDLSFTSGSAIEGCEELWKGITVKNGGTLRLLSGTGILDAAVAINAEDGASLELNNSFFINNYIGIGSDLNGGSFNFIDFDNNKFRLNGLKPTNASMPTLRQAAISIAGNSGTSFTASVGNPNIFNDYFVGVNIKSSSVIVGRNRFDGTTVGVNVEGTPNVVDGNTAFIANNKMTNTNAGILNGVHGLLAIQNIINNTNRGIFSSFSANRMLGIGGNEIDASRIGVGVSRSNESRIQSNIIYMGNNPTSTGIGLNLGSNQRVSNNTIDATAMATGIFGNSIVGSELSENTISSDADAIGTDAIHLSGSQTNMVNCNQLNGPGFDGHGFTNSTGILVESSPFNGYSCNYLNDSEEGMRFIGDDRNSVVQGNTFYNHADGIQIHEENIPGSSIISEQEHEGNTWQEITMAHGLINHTADDLINDLSQFVIDDTNTSDFYLPRGVVEDWFPLSMVRFQSSNNLFQCSPCLGNGTGANFIQQAPTTGMQDSAVEAQDSTSSLSPNERWIWKTNILKATRTYIGTSDYLPWMTDFENDMSGTDVYDVVKVLDIIDVVSDNTAAITDANNELGLQLQELYAHTSGAGSVSAIDSIRIVIDSTNHVLANLLDAKEIYNITLLAQAQQILSATTTTTNVAQDYVTVLTQLVAYLNDPRYILSATDETALVSIAKQCHIQYGRAVFISRALLANLTTRNDNYDNLALCTLVDPRNTDHENIDFEEVEIYPNPTHNLLTLSSKLEFSNYKISNISGKPILTGTISSNSIDVSQLTSGIYVVELADDEGKTHSVKFVKQ